MNRCCPAHKKSLCYKYAQGTVGEWMRGENLEIRGGGGQERLPGGEMA